MCYVTLTFDCQRIHRVSKLLLLILLLLFVAFFQSVYNYMSQTNHVFRVYNVTAILWSQFVVRGILFLMVKV